MKVTFHGACCFSFEGKNATIIIDPSIEQKNTIHLDEKILLTTQSEYAPDTNLSKDSHVCDWPGEYEISGVSMTGVATPHYSDDPQKQNTLFRWIIEGMKICHLGNITKNPSSEIIEKIGDIDVLCIPIGGRETFLNAKEAKDIIERIEPRIVLPMKYGSPDSDENLDDIEKFFHEMGEKDLEQKSVFSVSKSSLPQENTEVVWLETTDL